MDNPFKEAAMREPQLLWLTIVSIGSNLVFTVSVPVGAYIKRQFRLGHA